MSVSPEQKAQILALIDQGISSPEIANQVGVGTMVVAGYRAALTLARASTEESGELIDALETTFGLERDLQEALRHNIEQLEKGLKITDGGKEQKVASGFIDITAEDQQGNTVVIELKAGSADRETIGQILGYMGDLSHTRRPVRGIIVAGDFALAAISALGALNNLQLKKYSFNFSFESVGSGV
jgi:RecB family endonuclease NucS